MTSNGGTARPKLPALVVEKLSKTGYTRGATVREIYQNRVTRYNPVLIPWDQWELCKMPNDGSDGYENGFIVIIEPQWYFMTPEADEILAAEGVELGVNALLYYNRRFDWLAYRPTSGTLDNGKPFQPATSRSNPLGGTYFARIHATTAADGVVEGFNSSALRGAGIRVYEYASSQTISDTKIQLEALFWACSDVFASASESSLTVDGMKKLKEANMRKATERGLWDTERLRDVRMLNSSNQTVCPLCLNELSALDFIKRSEQAEGRETYDLTATEISLFHIQELRVGKLQHRPYNLGWGHHHCNVVVKDAGIIPTLEWMKRVVDNNGDSWQKIQEDKLSVEKALSQ